MRFTHACHLSVLAVLALAMPATALAFPRMGRIGRPAIGDSRLLARLPADPGYPEGILVMGLSVFVSGPAALDNGGAGPSVIYQLNRLTGRRIRTIELEGEMTEFPHGVAGMAADLWGRVYVLSTQLGVVRLDRLGRQEIYTPPLPDLPACPAPGAGGPPVGAEPCSPVFVDLPPLPNDIAFDRDGTAFVTDSLQATLWRIPPGGGPAEIWFQDVTLFSEFGPNGVRIGPDGDRLYFAQTDPGVICSLPLVDAPTLDDLKVFHAFEPFNGPDGMAFGAEGHLYVTLALSHQIAVLSPEGEEIDRFEGPIRARRGDIDYDMPASLAFDPFRRSLLVVNHSLYRGDPAAFAVFSVFVDDVGLPLARPGRLW